LDRKGQPTIVERTLIKPPSSRPGPVTAAERKAIIKESPVAGEYDERLDRKSAFEILQKRTAERVKAEAEAEAAEEKKTGKKATKKKSGGGSRGDSFWTTLGKAFVRSVLPMLTRVAEDAIKRGTLGGMKRR
jgi:DNA helicase HerA-like ATPase